MNNISNTAAGKLDAAGANLAATAAGSFQAAGSHQDPGTGVLQQIQVTGDHLAAGSNQDRAAGADHAEAAGLSCTSLAAGTDATGQDAGTNQEPGSPAAYYQEIRVYGINPDELELSGSIQELEDQEFQEIAEQQGLVWSLSGFQEDFNNDWLSSASLFIRFIITKK